MKKLLTLLMTVIIGCLPMWSAEVTDIFSYEDMPYSYHNETLTGASGAEYFVNDLTCFYALGSAPFNTWKYFTFNTDNCFNVTKSAGNIKSISIEKAGTNTVDLNVYVSNSPIEDVASLQPVGKLKVVYNHPEQDVLTLPITGDYAYCRVQATTSSNVSSITFTWDAVAQTPKCEMPTLSVSEDDELFPGSQVELAAPTADSKLTYTWGVKNADNTDFAAATTETEAASPATITIPADAQAGMTFYVNATATLDGYDASDELQFSKVLSAVVVPDDLDHITVNNLKAQNPDGKFDGSYNGVLNYAGTKGEYTIQNLTSDGSWWQMAYPGYLNTTKSGGYLSTVTFDVANAENISQIEIYVSENQIDPTQYYQANRIYVKNVDGAFEWTADGIYNYIYINYSNAQINDLAIAWTDTKPEAHCVAPEIQSPEPPYTNESRVYISVPWKGVGTTGATLHVDVLKDGQSVGGDFPYSTTDSWYNFLLPGKAGDTLVVEAWLTNEENGYLDSEKATETYTLEMATAATPSAGDARWNDIVAGMTVTIEAFNEGATLNYSWGVKNADDTDFVKHDEVTGAETPVTITIPEDVEAGMKLWINAIAVCDGYKDSEPLNFEKEISSNVLAAPTFQCAATGTEVEAGTIVRINRPDHADTIHYTLNGGEEQTSTEWSVEITINEDTEFVAWATATSLYKESPKATATYIVEKFGENIDVIIPTNFTGYSANAYGYVADTYTWESANNSYQYNGGFYPNGMPCFYSNNSEWSILYNTKGDKEIARIRIDSPSEWAVAYVKFSATEAITTVQKGTEDLEVRSANNYGEEGKLLGQWINVTSANDSSDVTTDSSDVTAGPKYFALWINGSNGYVNRVLVEYDNTTTGIDGIEAESGEEMFFDLNGVRVNSLENAVPGVYVRVANGKATKVLVK